MVEELLVPKSNNAAAKIKSVDGKRQMIILNFKPENRGGKRCAAEAVTHACKVLGWKQSQDDKKANWSIAWIDVAHTPFYKSMKYYQKVNHFPGVEQITRKRNLGRNLNEMKKQLPMYYNFFPETWVLPQQSNRLLEHEARLLNTPPETTFSSSLASKQGTSAAPVRWYICKPDASCEGKGVFITSNIASINPDDQVVVQEYVARPLLINRRKFDMRVYVLLTSCTPLNVFVYSDGLARFCSEDYCIPDKNGSTLVDQEAQLCGHLTNYALNKVNQKAQSLLQQVEKSDKEVEGEGDLDGGGAGKWSLSKLMLFLRHKHGVDAEQLWGRVCDVLVRMLISVQPTLAHNYRVKFPSRKNGLSGTLGGGGDGSGQDQASCCFQLLGADIMLDDELRPYLLECNRNPALKCETALDRRVKEGLLKDTFAILDNRSYTSIPTASSRFATPSPAPFSSSTSTATASTASGLTREEHELDASRQGKFRRVFPLAVYPEPAFPMPASSASPSSASSSSSSAFFSSAAQQVELMKQFEEMQVVATAVAKAI